MSPKERPLSFKTTTKSASFASTKDLSTPIFSTSSPESLIPAVSFNNIGKPLIFMFFSITSLVVPSTLVTIDWFLLTRRLNRVDFPAFGGPNITTDAPD